MANDLDDLMARLDADPTMPHTEDLDRLIAHYRALRGMKETGTAPKSRAARPKAEAKPIDIAALGLVPAKPAAGVVKRRV